MKIEKGKFYRTRGGEKVEVLTTERNSVTHPIVVMYNDGELDTYTIDGQVFMEETDEDDLISEWTDPVEIPWRDYPTWCKWVAMDGNGRWAAYATKPVKDNFKQWVAFDICCIPEPFHPRNFTGVWNESLFERPCE